MKSGGGIEVCFALVLAYGSAFCDSELDDNGGVLMAGDEDDDFADGFFGEGTFTMLGDSVVGTVVERDSLSDLEDCDVTDFFLSELSLMISLLMEAL